MIDFISFLIAQTGFTIFLNGLALLTLAALLRNNPAITRAKLSLQWLIPGIFLFGFARMFLAYAEISQVKYLVNFSNIFIIAALHCYLEFTRKSLPQIGNISRPALIHIPALLALVACLDLENGNSYLQTIYGLFVFLISFACYKAMHKLPETNKTYVKVCVFMAILATAIHLIGEMTPPSSDHAIAFKSLHYPVELMVILLMCITIVTGKFRFERRLGNLSALHTVLAPTLFLAAVFLMGVFGAKFFINIHAHSQSQAETNLDDSAESLLQLINQRIFFAETSSRIVSDSPIMAQFLANPDQPNKALLENFLNSFDRNNPDGICYLMDRSGLVLATSAQKDLIVGNKLNKRQYFQAALNGRSGQLIDFGLLTGKPGYYSSNPVRSIDDGKIIGVCAVKRNLEDLDNYLKLYHPAMIVDPNEQIFFSSQEELVNKKLVLPVMGTKNITTESAKNIFSFSNKTFAFTVRQINVPGWRIVLLATTQTMTNNVLWLFTTIILITIVLITLFHGTITANEARLNFELAREQFRVIFYHAPGAMLIISATSQRILAANNSMLRKFNLTDTKNSYYHELIAKDNHRIRSPQFNAEKNYFKHERDFMRTDDGVFSAEVTGAKIQFSGNPAILLLLHDLTAHKQIELDLLSAKNAAEEANLLKTRFFANASHEIRTPITAIIGLTELTRSFCSSDEQRKLLDLIKTSEKSLLTLLNDILDLSRIEAGQLSFKKIPFSLKELLNSVVSLTRYKVGKKKITVHSDFDFTDPDIIISDPDRIRQILFNLLDNGVKFTEKGRIDLKITITDRDTSPRLQLQISDTGCGIASEIHNELFLPFANADPLHRDSERGAGLGLAICKQIVDKMDGEISFSSSISIGTTFKVILPIEISMDNDDKKNKSTEFKPNIRLVAHHRPLRFLVADDNDINLFLATSIIEKFGGFACCAKNGLEAIKALQIENYDAILIDIQMPILDGIEAIKQIRAMPEKCTTPIIAISAFASNLEKEKAMTAGANFYLSKPYFPDDLIMAIKSVLDIEEQVGDAVINTVIDRPTTADEIGPSLPELLQIDFNELEIRILKKPENVAQVNEIFSRRSSTLIDDIDSCIAEQDHEKFGEICHSTKGLAGMLGATRAFNLAMQMEHLCRDGKFAEAVAKAPTMKQYIKEIAQDLEVITKYTQKKSV